MEDFIGKYKMDAEVCDNVLKFFNKNKKRQSSGVVGNNDIDYTRKDSTDIGLGGEDGLQPLLKRYFEDLEFCLNKYKKKYAYSDKDQERYNLSGANIQQYKPGQGFKKWHYENTGSEPDSLRRHLVFMTYLNDCKNAGTEFYYQNKTFQCTKGRTLIWPSAWTHTHKGVISDKQKTNKYIITGWWSWVNWSK